MKPIDFPGANLTLTKPEGMTDEECAPLRVHTDGETCRSEWMPSPEERMHLSCGGRVRAYIENDGHPWLACRFDRPHPRPDLPWDAKENRERYRDIREALGDSNPFSGKYNCHIHERLTADQAAERFEAHLRRMIGP